MLEPILLGAGGLLTAVASVMGAWALVVARRNETRAAEQARADAADQARKDAAEQTRQAALREMQLAFDLQQLSMANVERDNERLRVELRSAVNDLVGRLGEMTARHRSCETSLDQVNIRLRKAEARIFELGG